MQNAPLEGRVGLAVFEYDFSKHGGAQGAITVGPKLLPKGAIVMAGIIHVKVACLGSSGTMAIQVASSEDILAATNVSSLTLNALIDVVPVGTAATSIRCTSAGQLTCTIATTDFTAGKVAIALKYVATD
jgi:hypothetical protein